MLQQVILGVLEHRVEPALMVTLELPVHLVTRELALQLVTLGVRHLLHGQHVLGRPVPPVILVLLVMQAPALHLVMQVVRRLLIGQVG